MPERRPGRRLAAGAVLAITLAAGTRPAAATEVTTTELHDLAVRAASDPSALAALRRVDRVDGRPVDVARALEGASGAAARARLHALDPGAVAVAPPAPAGDPRSRAAEILDQRRFRRSPVPRPLRGVFRTLGRWLRPILSPVGRFFARVFESTGTAILAGGLAILAAALVSLRLIGRRSRAGVEHAAWAPGRRRGADPDELERRAAEAERAGDLDLALHLRFSAGLLRLDRAGVVDDRPSLTTGALVRQVPSPLLHDLAAVFEEVAYGGRPASADDLAAARSGWPRVLAEARR